MTPSGMIARAANEGDAAAIAGLWRRFMTEEHEAVPDAEPEAALPNWSARLRGQITRGTVFVLEAGEGIVGFAGFVGARELEWVPSEAAYIVDMYIGPEHRRASAARKLFAALVERVASAGYKEVWTNTNVGNRRVRRLLEWWGFELAPDLGIAGQTDQLYFKRVVDAG
jgi:GNAT superfamily N-acetyltransferase